jgi:hypothetical protein
MNKKVCFIMSVQLVLLSIYTECMAAEKLEKYRTYLEEGTYVGFGLNDVRPQSRYYTFSKAFEHFKQHNGKIVVELGTSRSFVHGGLVGCNSDDVKYWRPLNPECWDWGAGFFTRMAAECLAPLGATIHTIDLCPAHIKRCQTICHDFGNKIVYYVGSSLDFLKKCNFSDGIDLLYLDTGDMTPIEPTAQLQLAEAHLIVERNLIAPNGIILIDDVKNPTPAQFGDKTGLGKSKYSLSYLLNNGFEIVENEYQIILKKKDMGHALSKK